MNCFLFNRRVTAFCMALTCFTLPMMAGCQKQGIVNRFVEPMEAAHAEDLYQGHDAIAMDIRIEKEGQPILVGALTFATEDDRSRIEVKDGPTMVFDGKEAWTTAGEKKSPRDRFMLLTWPYFFEAVYKIDDWGTRLEELGELPYGEAKHPAVKMTFAPGTGDAPDDWYIVYKDAKSQRLVGMAYIVTYGGRDASKAIAKVIQYEEHKDVDGVPIPMKWTIWNWERDKGPVGDVPVYVITLRNVRFVEDSGKLFSPPVGSAVSPMPPSKS